MFIYHSPKNDETAHILSARSRIQGGLYLPQPTSIPILNWGQSADLSDYSSVLNREIVKNKLHSLIMLHNVGILVPPFWTHINDVPAYQYPILGRRYNHSGGTDICLLKRGEVQYTDYYMKYIDKSAEFRVHVIGKTSFISQKLPARKTDVCWNNRNGARFRDINIYQSAAITHRIREIAHKATTALGYDFGAVDIIVGRYNDIYCLEVNSAPALSDARIEKYIDLIKFNWDHLQEGE